MLIVSALLVGTLVLANAEFHFSAAAQSLSEVEATFRIAATATRP
jgi:hypothetical protein